MFRQRRRGAPTLKPSQAGPPFFGGLLVLRAAHQKGYAATQQTRMRKVAERCEDNKKGRDAEATRVVREPQKPSSDHGGG